jgi:hypothetical protein
LPPAPPPGDDPGPRYAARGSQGGDDGAAGGSGRAERPLGAGHRGWYNARARRGSDADPDEHSFRPRERQRSAVDPADADAYYRDRLRSAQADAGAAYDERFRGSGSESGSDEEGWDEDEEEDEYSHDARLAAQTRAEMAGQRRAAREHRLAMGEDDNRRTATGRRLDNSDDEDGPNLAPLLDNDILQRVRLTLALRISVLI